MIEQGYILVVEDDPMVQANNKRILERRGYVIRQAYTLAEAWAIVAAAPPRAIILDIELPDGDGLEFLDEFRKTSNIPVLILTAMGTPADVIKGLETGGDYYLPKPYDLQVFLKHMEALLRRAAIVPDALVFGPFKLVPASGTAYLNDENMLLAQKEFSLLQQFVQHPEKALSADYLYEKVWAQEMLDDSQALKKAISRLRKKLENSGYTITAERGDGYLFERE